jgi:hypothetical protein
MGNNNNNNNNKYALIISAFPKTNQIATPPKLSLNNHIFRRLLKMSTFWLCFNRCGRLFHSNGTQEETLRSPKPVRFLFTEYWTSPEDCVCRWFVLRRRMPSKYLGASPHIMLIISERDQAVVSRCNISTFYLFICRRSPSRSIGTRLRG